MFTSMGRWLVGLITIVFLSCCVPTMPVDSSSQQKAPNPPGTVAFSTSAPTQPTDAALDSAARQVIESIATVNYRDPIVWKNKLLMLSNGDGQKFWQLNFDRLLKEVIAHKRVTERVTLERVVVLEKRIQTDAQSKTITAAAVLVIGRVTYADDLGRHEEPINQPLILANLDGQWKFVTLIPPTILASPTVSVPIQK
ncbi:MAG: hypothetical protein HZB51_10665 [Chloroflexi bacterium]|nr:hypothetical protein [Chloroflexota bacterium]